MHVIIVSTSGTAVRCYELANEPESLVVYKANGCQCRLPRPTLLRMERAPKLFDKRSKSLVSLGVYLRMQVTPITVSFEALNF